MDDSDFYDDIHKYLEYAENNKSVNIKGFEELPYQIMAHTGVSAEVAKLILKSYFQEIRNVMLRGDIASIEGFGKFYIPSPKNEITKKFIFVKFKPYKQFLKKINE